MGWNSTLWRDIPPLYQIRKKSITIRISLHCLQLLFTPRLVLNVTFGTLNSFLYKFPSHSMLFIYFLFSSLFLFFSFPLPFSPFFSFLLAPFSRHNRTTVRASNLQAKELCGYRENRLILWFGGCSLPAAPTFWSDLIEISRCTPYRSLSLCSKFRGRR